MVQTIYEFYSGSYASETEDGIVKFQLDTKAGSIKKLYSFKGIYHPSYLCFNSSKTILYAVSEKSPTGKIHSLKVGDSRLTALKELSTEGADPCYISLNSNESLLFADNYSGGSLAVFKLNSDGIMTELSDFAVHKGKGINPDRQESAHIHCAVEHENKAFVVDLGLDKIFIYDIKSDKLHNSKKFLELPPGSGPRHLEFHKCLDIIYVVCELSNQVAVFKKNGDDYALMQMLSTLPEDFSGENTAAALKIYNNLLFASNRGHDSIAVYEISDDGLLELKQIIPTGGKSPRDFSFLGDYMVIANQDSDSVTVLRLDRNSKRLIPCNISVHAVKPSCIREF